MNEIQLSYDVPSDVVGAFDGFVDDFAQWWPRGENDHGLVEFVGRRGGAITIASVSGTQVLGEVTDWDPVKHLAWRHQWRHAPGVVTRVSIAFTESEWGTRVRLTHSDWDDLNPNEKDKFTDWPLILWHYVAHMRAIASHEDAA